MTFFGTDLSYRVLGFGHHGELPLPVAIQVPNPAGARCSSVGGSSP